MESTSKTVLFGLPEWILKGQMLHWCIVYHESTHRKRRI